MGSNWRIPTYTEWNNVDANGGWTNWNGPFGSALKLHAAGRLVNIAGSLLNRGSLGYYWSSLQGGPTGGMSLEFDASYSGMNLSNGKANGFSVRCVRQ